MEAYSVDFSASSLLTEKLKRFNAIPAFRLEPDMSDKIGVFLIYVLLYLL